jgi:hypothetical protein
MAEEYVPTPTFSERMKAAKKRRKSVENELAKVKKKMTNLPKFDDRVRAHRLPLVLKSKKGDSLQVYIHSYPRLEEEVLVYDVEFDDGAIETSVPRSALSLPPSSSYQLMMLQQESQGSISSTPQRRRNR